MRPSHTDEFEDRVGQLDPSARTLAVHELEASLAALPKRSPIEPLRWQPRRP
jgi:hypothetical protein